MGCGEVASASDDARVLCSVTRCGAARHAEGCGRGASAEGGVAWGASGGVGWGVEGAFDRRVSSRRWGGVRARQTMLGILCWRWWALVG